jgi:copper(I)-binding protein
VSSSKVHRLPRPGLRSAVVLVACLPTLLACSATGFGSPTRHAIANLQAATTKIGTTLQIEDAIIALPSDDVSAKGGLAYLEMDAINFSNQPDELMNVSADVAAPGSGAPSPAASGASGAATTPTQPAAQSLQAATDTTVPAATAGGPGTIRINVLLRNLTEPLRQGDTVMIGLTFHNSGTVSGLLVPVQGAGVVGTFLPTAPPPAPSSASASAPVASAPASSAPASTSPVAPPASSGSAPASASPLAATSS